MILFLYFVGFHYYAFREFLPDILQTGHRRDDIQEMRPFFVLDQIADFYDTIGVCS